MSKKRTARAVFAGARAAHVEPRRFCVGTSVRAHAHLARGFHVKWIMNDLFQPVMQTLDALEAQAAGHAVPGARRSCDQLEAAIARYLSGTERSAREASHVPRECILRSLYALRGAVDAGDADRIFAIASDLRSELVGHRRLFQRSGSELG